MTDSTMRRHEFTLTRRFDAPRELVWAAWTEPEQIARWWGPEGFSAPVESIELDLRPGGVFRLVMVLDEGEDEFPSEMEVRAVEAPERLAFGWEAQRGLGGGEVTVTFAEVDGQTELTTHFVGDSTDEMAAMAQVGWASQLTKLEAAVTAA